MVDDKTVNVSVSLYNSQVDKIKKYVKHSKRFNSHAALFQHMVNNFFETDKSSILKEFMVYTGYPVIIITIMLYVFITTESINMLLLDHGVYLNELLVQSRIFLVIGFAWIGLACALTYYFFSKHRSQD